MNKRDRSFGLGKLASAGLAILLAACAHGSMRIDVEVYDGPLSKSFDVQLAELIGTNQLSEEVLRIMVREIHLSQCRLGCFGDYLGPASNPNNNGLDTAAKICRSPLEETELASSLATVGRKRYEKIREDLVTDVFPPIVRDTLYKHYFPPKSMRYPQWPLEIGKDEKSKKWDANVQWPLSERHYYLPISKEDSARQVCPILSDVKANISHILGGYKSVKLTEPLYIPDDDKVLTASDFSRGSVMTPMIGRNLTESERIRIADYARKSAQFARVLREGAEHWATTQATVLLESRRARIVVARASIAAAELGNEIAGRSDAIIRQASGESRADILQQQLATSAYLREAEGTDYLNITDWLNAYPRREEGWSQEDRIRMLERLITDANWSKVNTVFAQGAGDTAMVFVKDDIGNWNLKSYENDPSELLKAYTDVGLTAVQTVAKLATGTGGVDQAANFLTKMTSAQEVAERSEEFSLGATGARAGGRYDEANKRVAARIEAVAAEAVAEKDRLEKAISENDQKLIQQQANYDNATSELDSAVESLRESDKQVGAAKRAHESAEIKLASLRAETPAPGATAIAEAENNVAAAANALVTATRNADDRQASLEKAQEATYIAQAPYRETKSNGDLLRAKLKSLPQTALSQISEILISQDDLLQSIQEIEEQ